MHLPTHVRSLAYRIQQLSVLPALVFISLLGATLGGIFSLEMADQERRHGLVASRWLASLAHHELFSEKPDALLAQFDTLLDHSDVAGVYLYDAGFQLKLQRGLRASQDISKHISTGKRHWHSGGMAFFASPVLPSNSVPFNSISIDNSASLEHSWIIVSTASEHLTLVQYRGIVAVLAAAIIGFGLLMALAWRLTRNIEQPLQNIEDTLQDYSQGSYNAKARIPDQRELASLAQTANTLGARLKNANDEVQQQITQATSDLQETLDTIEIQSIELDIARKRAVEASRIKSQFLANTSHEIRTPINGILGFTNLLLKTPINAQQREHLRTIALSSQGLLTIINDILDFSRLEENRLSLDRVPFELRQVVEETLQILAPGANEKELQLIHITHGEKLPTLMGDPLRIKQVLTNLVNNSIKFSDRGNIVVTTELTSRDNSTISLKVSVNDEGIGINNEHRELMFDAFTQADSSNSRQRGGTGLGLAISKKLIEKMGGTIALENRSGGGTCAWFKLSLSPQENPMQNRYGRLQGKKAVIFAGSPLFAQQLQQYANEWELDVEFVLSLEDVLPTLAAARQLNRPVDIVLLAAPGKVKFDGLSQMASEIQVRYGSPVLAAINADESSSLQGQAFQVLYLPFTHDHLYQIIDEALQQDNNKPAQPKPSQNGRILVVDDNPANLQLVCTFLQDLGFDPLAASSGLSALQLFHNESVDLVFMDVQMPEMDGLETTRRLRTMESGDRRTPVIALTAHDLSDQKYSLLEAGMDDFTSKPVSETQLAHLVQRWLHQSTEPKRTVPRGTPVKQQAIMDLQEALRLTNNKSDLARDMLYKLNEGLAEDAEAIVRLYREQQWMPLQELVHRLYGGCCYCGVPELRRVSESMDKKLLAGNHVSLDDDLNDLLKAIQRLRQWVDEHDLDILFDVEH